MTRRRRRGSARAARESFWGRPDRIPDPPETIRPTRDPGAMVRSLGDPPLLPHATAINHLAVVYEEAVRAATALAAANGLLADSDGDVNVERH